MHTRRIFWQLYPGYLAVTFFTLLVCLAVFASAADRFYRKQVVEHLEALAEFAAEQARDHFDAGDQDALHAISSRLGAKSRTRVALMLPDGTVVAESNQSPEEMENHRERPEVKTAIEQGRTGQAVRFNASIRKNMLYVAVPVDREGQRLGVIRTAMPLLKMNETVQEAERGLVGVSLAVLLLAALLSVLASSRISRPLERIKQGAEHFAAGNFSYRLHTVGSSEMGSLAETMNEMAAQLEERLHTVSQERNQREAVLSSMVEGVLAVDTAGQVISLNKAAAQFFSVFQPETAPGRSIEEVVRNVKLQNFIAEALEGQQTRECELTVETNQTTYYLQARGTNLVGLQGRRIGAVVVLNDISRLRRLEHIRRDFVANVSHELKTPITAIQGFVETLLDGAIHSPDEAERFLKIVARQADRLNAIIEDLLILSRLEQDGKEGMQMQKAELGAMLYSAVEICAQRAAAKHIAVHVESPENLAASANPPLIEQALINLIDNAIKYSPDGKTVAVSARTEEGGMVLSVKDQGYGIEEKHLERLFERFYRVDQGRSRKEGGTGLGLSIVKHIAQAHGGRVSVESRYGHGSTFSIFLPA